MTEKKRIPFDLERALAGDKVVTRDGREVSEIHHFKSYQSKKSVIAIIDGELNYYTVLGGYWSNADESSHDIFMVPKVKTYWVNVYKWAGDGLITSFPYGSESEAKKDIRPAKYIKTIQFEAEE